MNTTTIPTLPAAGPPSEIKGDCYPSNWLEISVALKAWAGGRCEHCGRPNDYQSGYVLTVHHLNGIKSDCRFENLLAACQRCHLSIQGKWRPGQPWLFDKPEWAEIRGY